MAAATLLASASRSSRSLRLLRQKLYQATKARETKPISAPKPVCQFLSSVPMSLNKAGLRQRCAVPSLDYEMRLLARIGVIALWLLQRRPLEQRLGDLLGLRVDGREGHVEGGLPLASLMSRAASERES